METDQTVLSKVQYMKLSLVSPRRIRLWSEQFVNGKFYGHVHTPNTLHHKTLKPQNDGLFCERIFGPVNDYECACGKRRRPTQNPVTGKSEITACPVCDVQHTWRRMRRYKMGMIQLATPVSHVWYVKGTPSWLSMILDTKRRRVEEFIYCQEISTLEYSWTQRVQSFSIDPAQFFSDTEPAWSSDPTDPLLQKKVLRELPQTGSQLPVSTVPNDIGQGKDTLARQSPPSTDQVDESHLDRPAAPGGVFVFARKKEKKAKSRDSHYLQQRLQNHLTKRGLTQASFSVWEKFYENLVMRMFVAQDRRSAARSAARSALRTQGSIATLQSGGRGVTPSASWNQRVYSMRYSMRVWEQTLACVREIVQTEINQVWDSGLEAVSTGSCLTSQRNLRFSRRVRLKPRAQRLRQLVSLLAQKKPSGCPNLVGKQQSWGARHARGSMFHANEAGRYQWKAQVNGCDALLQPKLQRFLSRLHRRSMLPQSMKRGLALRNHPDYLSRSPMTLGVPTLLGNNKVGEMGRVGRFEAQTPFRRWCMQLRYAGKCASQQKRHAQMLNLGNPVPATDLRRSPAFCWFNGMNIVNRGVPVWTRKMGDRTRMASDFVRTDFVRTDFVRTPYAPVGMKRRAVPVKKPVITNLLYVLSHRYGWDLELEWQDFATYAMGTIQSSDQPLACYQYLLGSTNPMFERVTADSVSPAIARVPNAIGEVPSLSLPVGVGVIRRMLEECQPQNLKHMADFLYTLVQEAMDWIPRIKEFGPELSKFEQRWGQHVKQASPISLGTGGAAAIKQSRKDYKDFQKFKKRAIRLLKRGIRRVLNVRTRHVSRLKLLYSLIDRRSKPQRLLLHLLPVLPPELRPILKIQDQITTSDLNRLYQRIMYRNARVRRYLKQGVFNQSTQLTYSQRLLQEAVDNLIENGKTGVTPERDLRGRLMKSLSQILKGKQGRFRQHLLGKRVDYSGRSVIVVGPQLQLYECGIPKEMALELFKPFLVKYAVQKKLASTLLKAKEFFTLSHPSINFFLEEVMRDHAILLNRAPTLHRMGFQAFKPRLVQGRAILLHPLVCPPFNADFDGDQMAVHVPISVMAQAECLTMMFSAGNLVSPATGDPVILPSQDMVLGCYYMTLSAPGKPISNPAPLSKTLPRTSFTDQVDIPESHETWAPVFSDASAVVHAWQNGYLQIHTCIWMRWNGAVEDGQDPMEPLEMHLYGSGHAHVCYATRREYQFGQNRSVLVQTTPGRVLFHHLVQKNLKDDTLKFEKNTDKKTSRSSAWNP